MIIEGLDCNAYSKRKLGKNNGSFSFIIENDNGGFEAGIAGFHYYGCFFIDLLFVKEPMRGKGYGSRLVHEAEKLARKRKCLFMAVNTMDFEAKPFYEQHGFEPEFVRKGFEKEVEMYYMRKPL